MALVPFLSAFCPCTQREPAKISANRRGGMTRYFAGLSRVVALRLALPSTSNPRVAGSTPAGRTNKDDYLPRSTKTEGARSAGVSAGSHRLKQAFRLQPPCGQG